MSFAPIDERYTPSSETPALRAVSAAGRIEGPLFDMTVRQTYENAGSEPLEVLYTFPLPVDAVLLGFASELSEARKIGVVVARAKGEHDYEQALAQGDAPVMIEQAASGLLTANIGNLKPGERLVVELRWAQWLRIEQGCIRVAVPTAIAPRYGDAQQHGGLQPQQAPMHSLEADYPLELTLDVRGGLGRGDVTCPTHAVTTRATDDGLRLTLAHGAALDRDVVFTLRPGEAVSSLALQGDDRFAVGTASVALVALLLPQGARRESVSLKVLVDCSGSMAGDSIASAKRALAHVAQQFGAADRVSYSRFGSTVAHDIARLRPCDASMRRHLDSAIAKTEASLGGTEMEQALRQCFALGGAEHTPTDVLLVTDGEVWDADGIVGAARASGHRVFAIGVGSAPAESMLRAIAEATGGACEFATPGESLEQAVDRSFARIRQQPWTAPRLRWGEEPAWTSPLPPSLFGGDTLLASAGFCSGLPQGGALLATDASGREVELLRFECGVAQDADSLSRMSAAARLCADGLAEQDAERLALAYQLVGEHTVCLLVHERAEADKVVEAARQHVVPQMLAAGWGGTGSVGDVKLLIADVEEAAPRYLRKQTFSGHILECRVVDDESSVLSLRSIVELTREHIEAGRPLDELAQAVFESDWLPASNVRATIDRARQFGLTESEAWMLLALWMCTREGDLETQNRLAKVLPDKLRRMRDRAFAIFSATWPAER